MCYGGRMQAITREQKLKIGKLPIRLSIHLHEMFPFLTVDFEKISVTLLSK